jgi:hypothetical protein
MTPLARIASTVLLASLGGSAAFSAGTPLPVPPDGVVVTEDAFLDSLGVNVHVNYNDGAYANLDKMAEDLRYIGFRHIRTHAGGGVVPIASYVRLGNSGLRFNLIARTNTAADTSVNFAAQLMKQAPGSVASVEGFNEINNWPVTYRGEKSENAAKAAQAELYSKVKANPELARVPVLYFTGGTAVSDLSGMADVANVHAYNNNANQPGPWLTLAMRQFSGEAAQLPRMNTEFGNFALPEGWPAGKPWWGSATALGVDQDTQARITLNAIIEGTARGFARGFIYELLDEKPDPAMKYSGMHYGLFTFTHQPKAAATALHNLTGFLREPASSGASGTVSATVEETSDSIGWIGIRRKDGGLVLAVWNRSPLWRWNQQSSTPVKSAMMSAPIRVTSNAAKVQAEVFDPLTGTRRPLESVTEGYFDLSVPNYPLLVWLKPN